MKNARPSPDPRSSIWAWIAYELRFCRVQRGLSGQDLAKILNCGRSSISRLETGESQLDDKQAALLDKIWSTGGRFSLLLWYARLGHTPDWLNQYIGLEDRASMIKIWQMNFVPGLLQTPEYARTTFMAGDVKDVEAALEARMTRQEILNREDPPLLWVLLFEGLLDIPVGGPEIMRAQLAHLLEMSERRNVSIRVVPKTAPAHPGLDGAFMLLSVDNTEVAYVEAPEGGRLVVSAEDVRSFVIRYDRTGQEALPAGPSQDLIRKTMEAM
ncbi:helix-turn-helix domain-containing protein [Actinomadura craniellae]|nr:helix-turn-helix transcriptional regulator [Actinomadura craniellae]